MESLVIRNAAPVDFLISELLKKTKSEKSLGFARGLVENLYLPLIGLYEKYSLERNVSDEGGVSGNSGETTDGRKLSTDIGCAYMCLDGLSAYYEIIRDDRVKIAINRLIDGSMRLDRTKMRCQTRAALSAARGILGMYLVNGKEYIGIPTFIGRENVGAKLKVCDAKPKTDLSV